MTEIHDPPAPRRDELRLLLEDLACVSGTLSEIMTAWRRVQPGRPELRLGRLSGSRTPPAARRRHRGGAAAAGGLNPGRPSRSPDAGAWGIAADARETRRRSCIAAVEAGDRGPWLSEEQAAQPCCAAVSHPPRDDSHLAGEVSSPFW